MNIDDFVAKANTLLSKSQGESSILDSRIKTELTVRRVRDYLAKGILDKPTKDGKELNFDEHHLTQILAIRALQAQGLSDQTLVRSSISNTADGLDYGRTYYAYDNETINPTHHQIEPLNTELNINLNTKTPSDLFAQYKQDRLGANTANAKNEVKIFVDQNTPPVANSSLLLGSKIGTLTGSQSIKAMASNAVSLSKTIQSGISASSSAHMNNANASLKSLQSLRAQSASSENVNNQLNTTLNHNLNTNARAGAAVQRYSLSPIDLYIDEAKYAGLSESEKDLLKTELLNLLDGINKPNNINNKTDNGKRSKFS